MIRKLDRYELLEEVGAGGMASVYRALDASLKREVAVKVMHPHLAARPESRARFSREARAVARLRHPHILEIFDYAGDGAKEAYLVTEFVRGRTLKEFSDAVGFGYPEIGVLFGRALADALDHAHGQGVIHRDLKPENVLVATDPPALKLADFGIARIVQGEERMTMTGALVGSPNHMAPEIVEGKEADAKSDVFSLGTLLYWLATGKLPFSTGNPTATLRRILEGEYEDPRAASPLVSDALAAAIARAMNREPARRQASAAELREELDAVLAEAGLARPDDELTAFLSDPAAYRAAFPARAVAALLGRAEAALAAAEGAKALALLNRVLALDPQNAPALALLDGLNRRARRRRLMKRAAAAAGALAFVGAGAVAGVRVVRAQLAPPSQPSPKPLILDATNDHPPHPALPRPPPQPAPHEEEAAAAPEPEPATKPAKVARREQPPRKAHVEPPAPPPTAGPPATLPIHVRPYAERVLVDGVEVAHDLPPATKLTLTSGVAHKVEIDHSCCVPFVREIPPAAAGAELPELKVPLEPRPAEVHVQASDPDADVFIDGKRVGRAGDLAERPAEVPIAGTPEQPYERDARVRLERAGFRPFETTIRLRAGRDVTVAATLEPAT